jgi:hypothetical protein
VLNKQCSIGTVIVENCDKPHSSSSTISDITDCSSEQQKLLTTEKMKVAGDIQIVHIIKKVSTQILPLVWEVMM